MFSNLKRTASAPMTYSTLGNATSKQCDAMGVFAGVAAIGAIAGIGKLWWDTGNKGMSKEKVIAVVDELSIAVQQVYVRVYNSSLALLLTGLQEELRRAEIETMKQAKDNGDHIDINHLRQVLRHKFV